MPGKGVFCFLLVCCLFAASLYAGEPPPQNMKQTGDGLIVYPLIHPSGYTRAVQLQVISDKIIRVIACPTSDPGKLNNLISVHTVPSRTWKIFKKAYRLILKTPALTSTVILPTAISFADRSGIPTCSLKWTV